MISIFAKLLYEIEKHQDTMLVTIVSEAGSSPRGTGSQMLVGSNGLILGTIGGGAVEHRSVQLGVELLKEKRSGHHDYILRANDKEDIGMACGGNVSVHFQYISGEDAGWVQLASALLKQNSHHKGGWLVQRLDGSFPTLLGEAGEILAGAPLEKPESYAVPGCMLTETAFSMPLPGQERAVIFGCGHIAKALAPLLKTVGFRVTLMDNRPEFADPQLFPDAEAVICGDYLKLNEYLTLDTGDYVVIMTNGHSHDYDVEHLVLQQETAYVGVIGSRRKIAVVNQRLREAGISDSAIAHVHTPIGMSIKAVTPEEIAVSIAGEMIMVRATRRENTGVSVKGCPMH